MWSFLCEDSVSNWYWNLDLDHSESLYCSAALPPCLASPLVYHHLHLVLFLLNFNRSWFCAVLITRRHTEKILGAGRRGYTPHSITQCISVKTLRQQIAGAWRWWRQSARSRLIGVGGWLHGRDKNHCGWYWMIMDQDLSGYVLVDSTLDMIPPGYAQLHKWVKCLMLRSLLQLLFDVCCHLAMRLIHLHIVNL